MYEMNFLKDYIPSKFFIDKTDLTFIIDNNLTIVNSILHIRKRDNSITDNFIKLDGINLNLKEIKINGNLLDNDKYKYVNNELIIKDIENEFILETTVEIYPCKNLSLIGLYQTDGNLCTQNEPHGFRHITYFLDRPDVLTKFTVTIIADKDNYPVLLSNGNLIKQQNLAKNKHCIVWNDPYPKSAYLFALVAGKYDFIEDYYITSISNRKIVLRIFADKNEIHQCYYAMNVLKKAMFWDEREFGLEYDLDIYQIVAVKDFNFGAMENKSLNIFNSKLLLGDITTTTDSDLNNIAAVVAHEYFHNWTGNRVTCRDWFQIGLKEGLTTLRENLFMEDIYGFTSNRIDSVNLMKTKQFVEDASSLSHPVRLSSYIEVDNFYSLTVYEKSSEIIRMLGVIFDISTLKKIICNFLRKFDGNPVTFEDFFKMVSDFTKINLTQFFLWFDRPGTPVLDIKDNINDDGTYTLQIKQIFFYEGNPENLIIPLNIGLLDFNGKEIISKTLIIDKNIQSFNFGNFINKPIPSLLRNFSAPVKIKYEYDCEKLSLLMLYDSNPISRLDASQKLITNIIHSLCKTLMNKTTLILDQSLINNFKKLLDYNEMDKYLISSILTFPSENYLLDSLCDIDICIIHQACEWLKSNLAKSLKKELITCYYLNNNNSNYLNQNIIGERKLKNLCLSYLFYIDNDEIFDIGLHQLSNSNNFTDIMAALIALVNSNYSKNDYLLNLYYEKWKNNQNMIINWLYINAIIKSKNTLERVINLLSHPAFDYKNPNKVRALILSFCQFNLNNFHNIDGNGYLFLADQIIYIDKYNPQLAASIIFPLINMHNLDIKRKEMMFEQLLRISKVNNLSKNVFELVKKTLSD